MTEPESTTVTDPDGVQPVHVDDPGPVPIRPRPNPVTWWPLAVFAALGLGGIAAVWWLVLPPPVLDRTQLGTLLARRDYPAAVALLESQVDRAPEDLTSRYLLAELLLERPDGGDSTPIEVCEAVLAHLARVRENPPPGVEPARLAAYRGKALYRLDRWDQAEETFLEALEIDPTVPEAAWWLLEIYYLEDRPREARELVLRLLPTEPDPVDRAKSLLLQLMRNDVIRLDTKTCLEIFHRVVEASPRSVGPRIALGRNHIRDSDLELGLRVLETVADENPRDPDALDALLSGLHDAGHLEEFLERFEGLPDEFKSAPRFARHAGLVAENRGDWESAIASYRIALEFDPADSSLYIPLSRGLQFTGRDAEAKALVTMRAVQRAAEIGELALYEEANAVPDLGLAPLPDLYHRLAEARAATGHPSEAAAWRAIADSSTNPAP